MTKKRKKRKRLIPFLLLAVIISAGIYFLSKFSVDYSGECAVLESRIDKILSEVKIPEKNTITWRVERKRGFRKWVEINKKIKLPGNKKQKLENALAALKNYAVKFLSRKTKIIIKRDNMIFARIMLSPIGAKPRLAIVIDDCGGSKRKVARLVELGIPLTFSILPYKRYTTFLAKSLRRAGFDTLLHQPMEPHKADNYALGRGALRIKTPYEKIGKILLENLEQTPFVKGVNNHMGSLFTEQPRLIAAVFETLAKKKLFFLDSATSRRSVCLEVADKMGFPCLRNNLFIDNTDNLEDIKKQILKGIRIAKKKGYGIIIGHSTRKFTAEALREEKEKLAKEVELVPLSNLYERN
ncbi:MAG: divergent polysaccharide deacetylase family protein [Elusimicrobia bacterium]|nr:divergent polysaccharide deacetylase family protein [Elusimicrobiota bacterium]